MFAEWAKNITVRLLSHGMLALYSIEFLFHCSKKLLAIENEVVNGPRYCVLLGHLSKEIFVSLVFQPKVVLMTVAFEEALWVDSHLVNFVVLAFNT